MQVTQEKVNNLNSIIKIKLNPSDYVNKVESAIKKYAKSANMPGFRKGMVPASLVKKMHGKSILAEEINQMLSTQLYDFIENEKLNILGQPLPVASENSNFKWDFTDEFEFGFEIGLAPDVEVNFSTKNKFKKYKIVADDESINERISEMRRTYGKYTNPEVAEATDIVYGEGKQLDKSGNILEGGIAQSFAVRLFNISDKSTLNVLTGVKKDDVLELDVKKAFNDDALGAKTFNLSEEDWKNLSPKFQFTVGAITRIEEAELNQELYDKIFGEGKVTNEEQLKEELRKEIEIITSNNSEQKLYNEIFDFIEKNIKVELPNEFLKRWLLAVNEGKLQMEEIENQFPEFVKGMKWNLLKNKIVKENSIQVTSEELLEDTKKKLANQFKMYGNMGFDDAMMTQFAQNYLSEKKNAQNTYDDLLNVKVLEHIKQLVTIEEKEIGFKEFKKLA